MASPQVKIWHGPVLVNVASQPAVQALAAKWLQIKTERDPCLADFWHDPDEAFSAHSVLFLKGETDYIYLHHGHYLRDRIGFSMQGFTLGELRTRIRDVLVRIYDRSASEFMPTYFQSFADFQQDVVLWGRLCLPLRLSAADPRVVILLYCHPIEDKASLSRAIFEHSEFGLILAAPIRDESGRIEDGWIIAQNEAASEVSGINEHVSSELLLRQVAPFRRDDLWTHLVDGLDLQLRAATVTSKTQGTTLEISMEMVREYILVRLRKVGVTKRFTTD